MSGQSSAALDAAGPLRGFRGRFELPDGIIYLDGNSLGALPRSVRARVARTFADEWRAGLIRSWNAAGWISLPQTIGAKLARLIGAAPGHCHDMGSRPFGWRDGA